MVVQTNKNAPNYQLVVIDLTNFAEDNWKVLVKEHPKAVLSQVKCVDKDKLVIEYQLNVEVSILFIAFDLFIPLISNYIFFTEYVASTFSSNG